MSKYKAAVVTALIVLLILPFAVIITKSVKKTLQYERDLNYSQIIEKIERIKGAFNTAITSKASQLNAIAMFYENKLANTEEIEKLLYTLNKDDTDILGLGKINKNGILEFYLPLNQSDKEPPAPSIDWINKVQLNKIFLSSITAKANGTGREETLLLGSALVNDKDNILFLTLRADLFDNLINEPAASLYDVSIINERSEIQIPTYLANQKSAFVPKQIPSLFPNQTVVNTGDENDKNAHITGYTNINSSSWYLTVEAKALSNVKTNNKVRADIIQWTIFAVIYITILTAVIYYLFSRLNGLDNSARFNSLNLFKSLSRLSSLGQLSVNIINEINNPLEIINQKAGLIQDILTLPQWESKKEKLAALSKGIVGAVNRVRDIVHRFVKFADVNTILIETVNVNDELNEVLTIFTEELILRNIAVNRSFTKGLPPLKMNRAVLQQLLLNGINLALRFLIKDGSIKVATWHKQSSGQINIELICETVRSAQSKTRTPSDFLQKDEDFAIELSISRQSVSAIGASVDFNVKNNCKALFTVIIPVDANIESAEEERYAQQGDKINERN
ncbi:signal transduction histidine kinase [Candidatus Magnetoovum chiemensis]|nr:signal transduction histidine kinase [Candidatus Magnetoovum chiemensis]